MYLPTLACVLLSLLECAVFPISVCCWSLPSNQYTSQLQVSYRLLVYLILNVSVLTYCARRFSVKAAHHILKICFVFTSFTTGQNTVFADMTVVIKAWALALTSSLTTKAPSPDCPNIPALIAALVVLHSTFLMLQKGKKVRRQTQKFAI